MNKVRISRKAWQRAQNALLWYPDNLQEYAALMEELMTGSPEKSRNSSRPVHPDPTAFAGMRLAGSRRRETLRQEIEAVELAVSVLRPEQKEVIRRRFWEIPNHGRRKPRQYDFLQDVGYSEDGMRWIVRKVICSIAIYLGEK